MILESGKYSIQGVVIVQIAQQFGTPLYVYDAQKIGIQIQALKSAFSAADLHIKYAAKASTNLSLLKLMHKYGVGVDTVSINETKLALHSGFKQGEIMFTPNGVGFDEVVEAAELGVGITIDNLSTLTKFGERYADRKPCSIRLNPGIMAGGNLKIATGHLQAKFGISLRQLSEILQIANKYNLNINGLHIHTGSEIDDVEVFMQGAEVLFNAAKDFPHLAFLDFGGGFKVAYKPDDRITDIPTLGSSLGKAFNRFCSDYGRKIQLWLEPGKFLVSNAGILLVRTNVVKETPDLTFVHVDSGLNHLLRPMMYDAYHEIINLSNPTGPQKLYTVVGYICETDTLGANRKLAEVREGDLLALKNAGAYGFSMASNYNSRLRPAEVLIVNGEAKLIRERENFEDLLRGQKDIDL